MAQKSKKRDENTLEGWANIILRNSGHHGAGPVITNDKDRATAKRIIKRYLDNDTNDHQLENEFIAALTAVRKEARQAAFKTALGQVKLLWSTSNSNSYNGAVSDAVRKIEAVANAKEGTEQ